MYTFPNKHFLILAIYFGHNPIHLPKNIIVALDADLLDSVADVYHDAR